MITLIKLEKSVCISKWERYFHKTKKFMLSADYLSDSHDLTIFVTCLAGGHLCASLIIMSYDLKNEKDVDDYIKNLGTEYRFGCFGEKKPEVCHLLGDYLEAISKDFEKAGKVYKTNCDSYKFGRSCLKTGDYFLAGKGGFQKSAEKAIEYFEKGCEQNEMASCFRGGLLGLFNAAKFPSRSLKQSVGLLEKSCEGRNKDACFHLSGLYMDGKDNGKEKIIKDMTKAFQFARKACDLGNIHACINVSIMYRKGDGVEKNEDESDKYRKIVLDMKKQSETEGIVFQQGLN